jgi:iron complex outermembrane receptor protein
VLELLAQGVTLARGTFPGGNPNNVTLYVDGRNNNLGQSTTRGVDFTLNYRLETEKTGNFAVNLSGTYLTEFRAAISPAGTAIDKRNTIFFPLSFKARGSFAWELDPVRVQLTATHAGGYDNNAITPIQQMKSYTPIDLAITWNIGDAHPTRFFDGGFAFTLEARNLLDADPPYVNLAPSVNGSGGYDASASNPIGRLFAASVRKRF